ncbi:hypothetical protein WMY93_034266 [Mugilogobius chulae]|uniref:Uncharacterized protein n=1 Tax=Mugilogobius chulae TaxID=88201 RepID=A0AAW0MPV5_9GOBI
MASHNMAAGVEKHKHAAAQMLHFDSFMTRLFCTETQLTQRPGAAGAQSGSGRERSPGEAQQRRTRSSHRPAPSAFVPAAAPERLQHTVYTSSLHNYCTLTHELHTPGIRSALILCNPSEVRSPSSQSQSRVCTMDLQQNQAPVGDFLVLPLVPNRI